MIHAATKPGTNFSSTLGEYAGALESSFLKRSSNTQIQLVINQVAQCVFEGTGESLDGQIDRKELQTGVDGFVAGHRCILSSTIAMKDIARCKMLGAILFGTFSTTSLAVFVARVPVVSFTS